MAEDPTLGSRPGCHGCAARTGCVASAARSGVDGSDGRCGAITDSEADAGNPVFPEREHARMQGSADGLSYTSLLSVGPECNTLLNTLGIAVQNWRLDVATKTMYVHTYTLV